MIKEEQKHDYIAAEMEVVMVDSADIICTSPGTGNTESLGEEDFDW